MSANDVVRNEYGTDQRFGSGAEPFLYSLLSRLEWDLAMSTSSLHCLKLDPVLRKSVADVLVPTSKIKVRIS